MVPRRIGNDVVDLGDRPSVTARHRQRFIDRVLAPAERALLESAKDPETLLWSLFAAKEAAFKVVAKLGPVPVFAHRKFVVSDDLHSVVYGQWTLQLDLDADAERVHAVASTFFPAPSGSVARVTAGADEGAAARALLTGVVSRTLGCSVHALKVVREPDPARWDGFGPPRVVLGGSPLPIDVSLSHDGGFVACAVEGA